MIFLYRFLYLILVFNDAFFISTLFLQKHYKMPEDGSYDLNAYYVFEYNTSDVIVDAMYYSRPNIGQVVMTDLHRGPKQSCHQFILSRRNTLSKQVIDSLIFFVSSCLWYMLMYQFT